MTCKEVIENRFFFFWRVLRSLSPGKMLASTVQDYDQHMLRPVTADCDRGYAQIENCGGTVVCVMYRNSHNKWLAASCHVIST